MQMAASVRYCGAHVTFLTTKSYTQMSVKGWTVQWVTNETIDNSTLLQKDPPLENTSTPQDCRTANTWTLVAWPGMRWSVAETAQSACSCAYGRFGSCRGTMAFHSWAASYMAAACRTLWSDWGGPMICRPTGSPLAVRPQGMEMAGTSTREKANVISSHWT